jgi:hypothetical protein
MVRIRYSELPAGLHVSAKRHGGRTTIYLLPGLTAAERKAALARVRSSARLGHGPPLPAAGMAVAVGVDRARTTMRNGAFAMRSHPVLLLPPLILLMSSAIVFVLMSVVTVTIPALRPQASGPQPSVIGRPQPAVAIPGGSSPAHQRGGQPGAGQLTPSTGAAGGSSGSPHGSSPGPSASPRRSSAPTSPSPGPSSSSPGPSPSPSSGNCVNLGALGLCLNL